MTNKSVYKGANVDNQTYDLNLDNFDLAVGITFYDGLSHEYEKQNLHKFANIEFTYYHFGQRPNENGTIVPFREY